MVWQIMAALIETLHQDHKNYAVLLKLLSAEADRLEQGKEPDFVRMYDIVNYMVNYPDAYHHPHEELVFDILNALEPDCSSDTRTLVEEHKQLALTGQVLKDALNGVINGAIIPMDRVLDNIATYLALFWKHMNLEESAIFPRAETVFEDSEWKLIDDKLSQVEDPLFGEVVNMQYKKLYEGILQSSDNPG